MYFSENAWGKRLFRFCFIFAEFTLLSRRREQQERSGILNSLLQLAECTGLLCPLCLLSRNIWGVW